jgi:hypothetical protein
MVSIGKGMGDELNLHYLQYTQNIHQVANAVKALRAVLVIFDFNLKVMPIWI